MKTAQIDEPWLKNKRWREGKIPDSSTAGIVFMLIFTLFWNAIAVPVFVMAWRDPNIREKIWLVGMFPAVGALLAAIVVWMILRRLKFGRSVFELETLPGQVGGYLAGTIRAATLLNAPEGIRLTLKCVNRVTSGSGKQRRTTDHVRWQDDQMLVGRLPGSGGATSIPVSFQIPKNLPETRDEARSDIIWRLRASASMDGADYVADFTVPVFRTGAAPLVPKAEALAAKFRRPAPPASQRASEAGILYSKDTAGRVKFHFPAARSPGMAAFVTIMALMFCGISIAVRAFGGAPLIIPILGCLFGGMFLIPAAFMWFNEKTITVRQDDVEIGWRMLLFSGTRVIPRELIVDVRYRINTQIGDTPYLEVVLHCTGMPNAKVAGGLRMQDARWVAGELADALGTTAHDDMRSESLH